MKELVPFHFYASSLGEWKVGLDLEALIGHMKRGRLSFTLWKVPGDIGMSYQIREFAPVVEGRVYLGTYQREGERWVQLCKEVAK